MKNKLKRTIIILLTMALVITGIASVYADGGIPDQDNADVETLSDVSGISDDSPTAPDDTEGSEGKESVDEETPFVFPEADISTLSQIDFSSKRLIVSGEIRDPEHLLSEYDGVSLLQYDTEEEARLAYLYYLENAEFADVDTVIYAADEEYVITEEGQSSSMDESSNPFALLSDLEETEESQTVTANNKTRVIALIDTGVKDVTVQSAVSVIGDSPEDDNGHGTSMANVIFEETPEAAVISIKALGSDGSGDVSAVYAAIRYAIDQQVDIINLSMSAVKHSGHESLISIVQEAAAAGITVSASAGNKGKNASFYVPGCIAEADTIGAADETGARLADSNYGSCVDYYVTAASTSEAAARYSAIRAAGKESDHLFKPSETSNNSEEPDSGSRESGSSEDKTPEDGTSETGTSEDASPGDTSSGENASDPLTADALTMTLQFSTGSSKAVLGTGVHQYSDAIWYSTGNYIKANYTAYKNASLATNGIYISSDQGTTWERYRININTYTESKHLPNPESSFGASLTGYRAIIRYAYYVDGSSSAIYVNSDNSAAGDTNPVNTKRLNGGTEITSDCTKTLVINWVQDHIPTQIYTKYSGSACDAGDITVKVSELFYDSSGTSTWKNYTTSLISQIENPGVGVYDFVYTPSNRTRVERVRISLDSITADYSIDSGQYHTLWLWEEDFNLETNGTSYDDEYVDTDHNGDSMDYQLSDVWYSVIFHANGTDAYIYDTSNPENRSLTAVAAEKNNAGNDKNKLRAGTDYSFKNCDQYTDTSLGLKYPLLTRDGYMLYGFNTAADGSGTWIPTLYNDEYSSLSENDYVIFTNSFSISDSDLGITSDILNGSHPAIHLYAQWRQRTHTSQSEVSRSFSNSGTSSTLYYEQNFGMDNQSLLNTLYYFIPETSPYGDNISASAAILQGDHFVWDDSTGRFYLTSDFSGDTTDLDDILTLTIPNRGLDKYGNYYHVKLTISNIKLSTKFGQSLMTVKAGEGYIFQYNASDGAVSAVAESLRGNRFFSASYDIKIDLIDPDTSSAPSNSDRKTMLYFSDLDIPSNIYHSGSRLRYYVTGGSIDQFSESISVPDSSTTEFYAATGPSNLYVEKTESGTRFCGLETTGAEGVLRNILTNTNCGGEIQSNVPTGLPTAKTTMTAVSFVTPISSTTVNWAGTSCTTSLFSSPECGIINIIKQDPSGNRLEGAVFGIYRSLEYAQAAYQAGQPSGNEILTLTTNSSGEASTDGFPLPIDQGGTYYVAELSAPEGYDRDPQIQEVTFTSTGTKTVTFTNTPKTGKITIEKVSSCPAVTKDLDTYSLKGAVFGIYASESDARTAQDNHTLSGREAAVLTTEKDGKSNTAELNAGTYYIAELKASPGYLPDTEIVVKELTAGSDTTLTIEEVPYTDTFGVQKRDENGDEVPAAYLANMEGAQFTLKYYDGIYTSLSALPEDAARTWIYETNTSGNFTADDKNQLLDTLSDDPFSLSADSIVLPVGTILVYESAAPEGFELSDKKYIVTLTTDSYGNNSMNFYNADGTAMDRNSLLEKNNMIYIKITEPLAEVDFTISKTIYKTDLHDEHGAPNFAFEIKGTTLTGKERTYHAIIDFTGTEEADSGTATLSKTVTVTAGSYTVTELKSDRFVLTDITAQGLTVSKTNNGSAVGTIDPIQPITGKAEGTILVPGKKVTFTNRKVRWDNFTHTTSAVNQFGY